MAFLRLPVSFRSFHAEVSHFHFPSLDNLPKPYYVWNFEDSLDDWVNDVANWEQKWELLNGAVCLHNVPIKSKGPSSKRKPWATSKAKKEEKVPQKSPLWSPPLPQDSGMRCLTIDYQISGTGSQTTSSLYGLAILQQQDG